ncbi:DUF4394 domain-containing protein [Deinococcus sp. YIM 134068]|uniref:DUF4394 domain-containing protein n=1 Tax=Deinococcus lichenicola TaxID=3118910 RepID=UPI002F93B4AD
MKRLALLSATCALALSACGLNSPVAPTGRTAYGLDTSGRLVVFGTDNATVSVVRVTLTGLGAGETLVDLDVFNGNGSLYALSDTGKLYLVNTSTGVLTANTGGSLGAPRVMDFNPAALRLRVFSTGDMNYRLTPATGTANDGTVTADGTLAYAASDANTGKDPNLVAAAYTNSFQGYQPVVADYTPATTLYSLDADLDTLVTHTGGPAFSTLNTVGTLGVDVSAERTGFDIAGTNEAYLTAGGSATTTLYTLDLTTGKATVKSVIPGLVLKAFAVQLSTRS